MYLLFKHLPLSLFRIAAAAFAVVSGATLSVAQPATTAPNPAASAEPRNELGEDWIRVTRDDEGVPVAMQVAIVRYTGSWQGRPVAVDLIGAVHVGDAAYYRQLNKRFRQYDALLYELVAPEGAVVDPNQAAESRSPVSAIQNSMKSMLELEHQLEKIDYRRPNFVHADMSPEEFFESLETREGGVLKALFRFMGHGIAMQSKQAAEGESVDVDLLRAMLSADRARQLKIVMAEQMADLEAMFTGFGGEAGSTLITERNKAAFEVLRRELEKGKRSLGVFYGAGHLTDMDQRLREEFSLKPDQITWLTAWDLTPGAGRGN